MRDKQNASDKTGKLLGIPYDLRPPTPKRLRERMWNSEDRRLWTPKTFGWGYDLNVYELGRRLRILGRN